jgi:hypothetical protein
MKTYGAVEVKLHFSLPQHYRQVSAPAALPLGKNPLYQLDRRMDEPQIQSGHCGEEKNLALPGIIPGLSSP